jgi:hypothetical protein
MSIEQIADKTQAEVQAMSRAAMDRLNAKVDTHTAEITPTTAPVAEEAPRRSARSERMSRPDRWERQIVVDPTSDPALLAAQDAAADSLMGNRAQRQQHAAAPQVAPIATVAPTTAPIVQAHTEVVTASVDVPAFVVAHQHIEQTASTEATDVTLPPIPDGMTKEELDAEDERALRIASGQEEGAPKRDYDDRRGRRSPYRRRGPRRPSNVRREHNNEHAAEFSAPANDSTPQ